jgi:hypothetical protein
LLIKENSKMKKLLVTFATLALALASAADKTYHVTLSQPASVNGTELKPGDYKVQVEGDKAVFKMGKTVVEAPAKVETAEHKYATTQIAIDDAGKQAKISEIRIGGTATRLVFSGSTAAGQ